MKKILQDALWKELIQNFFKDAMDFFAPTMSELIDYNKKYSFLDKELNYITKGERRYCDTLVQVTLKNKKRQLILVHIEVQGYDDLKFAERMFEYRNIIWLKYKQEIYSIAIFTNRHKKYMPKEYDNKILDVEIKYKYKTYEVISQKEEELKKQDNIFALVVLASLYTIKEKEDTKRADFKKELIKLLKEKNIDKEKRGRLFIFLDLMVYIHNEELRLKVHNELEHMIEGGEDKMTNYLRIENSPFYKDLPEIYRRRGLLEGINKGKLNGKIEVAKKLLQQGFSIEQISNITEIPVIELKKQLKSKTKCF